MIKTNDPEVQGEGTLAPLDKLKSAMDEIRAQNADPKTPQETRDANNRVLVRMELDSVLNKLGDKAGHYYRKVSDATAPWMKRGLVLTAGAAGGYALATTGVLPGIGAIGAGLWKGGEILATLPAPWSFVAGLSLIPAAKLGFKGLKKLGKAVWS